MTKLQRIWAVREGDYSDYRVQALFTTKALAEAHKEAGGGDRVEEFALFDRAPRKVMVYSINVRIWSDGSFTSEHRDRTEPEISSRVEWEYGGWECPVKSIMEARTLQAPYAGKDWLVRVTGTDKAKVLKVFHDRVAEARARTLGLT